MDLLIRLESPSDWPSVDAVLRDAFAGPDEAELVPRLRRCPGVLSLVAIAGTRLVGHVMFSPVTLQAGGPTALAARGLAPVSVIEDSQRRGIGSRLIEFGLAELRKARIELVFVLGHPSYYPRFGFVPATPLGLQCKWGGEDGSFQVLELTSGAAARCPGKVEFLPEFDEFD